MRKAHMRGLMREEWGKAPPRARDRARNPARTPLVETIKGKGKSPQALQRKTRTVTSHVLIAGGANTLI